MIKLLQHNFVKMMTWAVDSAISGVRITLSWWWRSSPSSSRSSSWEWRGWCEKGVWAVVHFVRKQSCARWRSCRGRKIQSRQNTRRTKQRGLGHVFPCILLTCVSTHYRTKWLETIFESHQSFLSTSLLPVWWLFDGSLLTAFCFYFFILVGQNQASMWRGSIAPWNILTNLSL